MLVIGDEHHDEVRGIMGQLKNRAIVIDTLKNVPLTKIKRIKKACVVVTDDYPAFVIPHMISAASQKISVPMEAIDSNGLLPMRSANRVFTTAYAFRRFLQKTLPLHLMEMPVAEPFKSINLPRIDELPKGLEKKWDRVFILHCRPEVKTRPLCFFRACHTIAYSSLIL